jgi:methionine-rich copper-binding protein CopC
MTHPLANEKKPESIGLPWAVASLAREKAGSISCLRVPRLGPGRYRVTWHIVTVDTHPTEDAFEFEVRP